MGNWNSKKGNRGGNGTREQELAKINYSLDTSPMRFTELYKPSHWHTIVVMFFSSQAVSIAQGLIK